jgi:Raf kinase inhibitor-like YbhB/YbcL family protein
MSITKKAIPLMASGALAVALVGSAVAGDGRFSISSATFKNDGPLPTSMAFNDPSCTIDGKPGGNTSPELSWRNAPEGVHSFVVIAYDITASFTHWGMYNIPVSTTSLPAGAGAADSTYGQQVPNDFPGKGYDGPCPPAGIPPVAHHYLFTVYALDTKLVLPRFHNFPQNPDTLFHALADAGARGHVLGSATIGGFYSATPVP